MGVFHFIRETINEASNWVIEFLLYSLVGQRLIPACSQPSEESNEPKNTFWALQNVLERENNPFIECRECHRDSYFLYVFTQNKWISTGDGMLMMCKANTGVTCDHSGTHNTFIISLEHHRVPLWGNIRLHREPSSTLEVSRRSLTTLLSNCHQPSSYTTISLPPKLPSAFLLGFWW